MMKRTIRAFLTLTMLIGLTSVSRAADMKDPVQIIKKSQAYVLSLDSYQYTVKGEGWDLNPEDNAKRQSAAAGDAAKNFKAVANVANDVKKNADIADPDKPVFKKYECIYKFKKPYLLQMKVIMSDYVPKIIYGSLLTYRPDQDPKVFYFKPKISPMGIKRDIGGESGDLLYSVMQINNAMMDSMSKNVKPALKGFAKVAGRDAYVVEFAFPKGKKLKAPPVDFKFWAIHPEAQKQFGKEVVTYTDGKSSRVVFMVDKENFLVLARETYDLSGKKINRKEWSDITVNTLSERDF